jgi:plastocyanin
MRALTLAFGLSLALALPSPAQSAAVMFEVTDQDGRPVPDAVVTVKPASAASDDGGTPQQIAIDQRNETFIPLVSIVPRGGSVIVSNSDRVRHHVYSFSPIKQFQMILNPGENSPPVRFEKAGVVAIGCNIHDKMVTYVYVTESRLWALTHSDGSGVIAAVPQGNYIATFWHPRLKPGAAEPTRAITVGAQPVTVPVSIAVTPIQPASHHHGGAY